MRLTVNGTVRESPDEPTITEFLIDHAGTTDGVAVAVDGEIVHRADWPGYRLRAGQSVELVAAMQGG
jgi:sulfur carrier protein